MIPITIPNLIFFSGNYVCLCIAFIRWILLKFHWLEHIQSERYFNKMIAQNLIEFPKYVQWAK